MRQASGNTLQGSAYCLKDDRVSLECMVFGAVNVPSNVRLGNDRKRVFISFSPMCPLALGETISELGNRAFAAFLKVSDKIPLVELTYLTWYFQCIRPEKHGVEYSFPQVPWTIILLAVM